MNNHRKLLCGICGNTHHVKCVKLTNNIYHNMSLNEKDNWMCPDCMNIFPFNHCVDDDLFLQLTSNVYDRDLFIPRNSNELLFEPFDLQSDIFDNNDWDEHDPDIQYYLKTQNLINMCNSEYYDVDQFNSAILNIQSKTTFSSKNADDLSTFLTTLDQQFDIIGLSETWLNENNDIVPGFSNYTQVHNYRTNGTGGGVSLLLRAYIRYHKLEDLSIITEIFESIFIEIETVSNNVIIGCIYRPPNFNLIRFNEEINILLKKLNSMNKSVYIMGDFNINLLNSSSHSHTNEFVNTMFSSSFFPLINRPTRISDSTATLIDTIFTNHHGGSGEYLSGILPTDISDHFTIFHIISTGRLFNKIEETFSHRIINDNTINTFKAKIKHTNWNSVLECKNADAAYIIHFWYNFTLYTTRAVH